MQTEPFFSGPGLNRADALRSDNGALEALARSPHARQLNWKDGLPKLAGTGALEWERVSQPDLFLGLDGDFPRFSAVPSAPAGARSAFPLMSLLRGEDAPLFAAALSLGRWHRGHPFCTNCGHSTDLVRGGWARRCPACSAEHYPRVDPTVIMLAEHDGRLLLGRQARFPAGRYSALAGFVEVGETLEAAVARELHEEAGIRVRNVRYVASQPWPFPSSLMLGCRAEALSDVLRIDTSELEDARWFTRDDIVASLEGHPGGPFQPSPKTAISRTLLELWLRT